MDDREYGIVHHAFLQAMMARRAVPLPEAVEVLKAIQTQALGDHRPGDEPYVDEGTVDDFIAIINDGISDLELEIRKTVHQKDGVPVWALVNTTSDEIAKVATNHNASEIAFFRLLLNDIFIHKNTPQAEVMAVSSIDALRHGRHEDVKLTQQMTERVLEKFVEEGWLECSDEAYYTLSPRTLLELQTYLQQEYNGDEDEDGNAIVRIKSCRACKDIITHGQRCSNMRCECRFHDFCATRFFTGSRQTKCPICKTEWTGDAYVGERSAVRGQGDRGRRRSRQHRELEEEDEEDE
ncbi:hypothetical protein YB2330_002266 [Saitoella coloradoensis]